MLPHTTQETPFAVTALLNPQNNQVKVIAARYNNGDRPQVTLGGDFDVDQICTIAKELLERADLPQNSPYFPVLQTLQKLIAQQQGEAMTGPSQRHLQTDWRAGTPNRT